MSSLMRSFRPDFRTIFNNLSFSERKLSALAMDDIYDTITKIVDEESLDEAATARLVNKTMLGAQQPERCFKVIMQAIWPSHSKPCFIFFKNATTTGPVSDSASNPETSVEGVEQTLEVNATNRADGVRIFEVIDSQYSIAMDDDTLIIEKGGRAVPLWGQLCAQLPIRPGGSYRAKQSPTTENPHNAPTKADAANNATQTPPSCGLSTPDSTGLSANHLPQPLSSSSIDYNATQTPPSGDFSTPNSPSSSPSHLPQLLSSSSTDDNVTHSPHSGGPSAPNPPGLSLTHPQFSSSSSIGDNTGQSSPSGDSSSPDPPGLSPSHLLQPPISSTDNNATQIQPLGGPSGGPSALGPHHILPLPGTGHHPLGLFPGRGSSRGQTAPCGRGRGGHRGGGHRGRGIAFTPSPAVNHDFIQRINHLPMPSGRDIQRTYGFTELSPPDAPTIILGPMPPPTLPSHVRTSPLPPGHPPQSYNGPSSFPQNHDTPGAPPGNSTCGTTSETTEGSANTSSTQPVVSDQSHDPSEILKKRSRDAEDDEEETSRPSIRLHIEALPAQSSQPDDTTAHAAPVASSSTLAPLNDSEGGSDSGSPKKRIRDAEEDEEEAARPSTRMRQELPVVRPRYPSPTPYDRRLGRIIAPFGTSIRFNPRPSLEVDIRSLEVAHNEANPRDNLPASSSGSSTISLASFDGPSVTRSSKRIKE